MNKQPCQVRSCCVNCDSHIVIAGYAAGCCNTSLLYRQREKCSYPACHIRPGPLHISGAFCEEHCHVIAFLTEQFAASTFQETSRSAIHDLFHESESCNIGFLSEVNGNIKLVRASVKFLISLAKQ